MDIDELKSVMRSLLEVMAKARYEEACVYFESIKILSRKIKEQDQWQEHTKS